MKNFTFISMYFFLIFALTSCENEVETSLSKVEGCTQANACNYNPNATLDDGSCSFCTDCSGNIVEKSELHQSVDINVFDFNPNSQYFNEVFSILTIDWIRDNYCRKIENNFTIKFKNTTSKILTFDYLIESNADGQIRSAQGLVQNLNPNETFEKNQGESAFWNLKSRPIEIRVNNISYE